MYVFFPLARDGFCALKKYKKQDKEEGEGRERKKTEKGFSVCLLLAHQKCLRLSIDADIWQIHVSHVYLIFLSGVEVEETERVDIIMTSVKETSKKRTVREGGTE